MQRVRRVRIHLLLVALLSAATACFAQDPVQPTTPDGIVHAVVDAIDTNYLKAHKNPLWNIAKDALLAGKYKDSSQVFQEAQKQLPYMEDSELNLLTREEVAAVQSEVLGQKIGVGLADFCLDLQIESGRARVVTPLMGSPAMKAGIQPGDVIVSIDGKATSDMNHEQVMDALRAPAPGGVKLQIERGERTVAAVLQPSSEKTEVLQSAVKHVAGKNIGYIRVALFTPDLGQNVREAVTRLERSGVDGYVLDLRNNPGGFLNSARDVAGLFVAGTIGYKVPGNNQKEAIQTQGTPVTTRPLAILINAGTASAAEVVSGGLQGLHRATIVGVRSYGRGRGQTFVPLAEGYGIQIPAVQLLTPSGQGITGKGIVPDVEVKQPELPDTQLAGPRDRQFLRAVQTLTSTHTESH